MSNIEQKDFEIGGEIFSIRMFPATEGLKVATKLLKIIGEPLAELAKGASSGGTQMDNVADAIKSLAPRLDEENVVALCMKLTSVVLVPGQHVVTLDKQFNNYFAGKYGLLFKLLVKVVEYNFADFLDGLPLKNTGAMATPQA